MNTIKKHFIFDLDDTLIDSYASNEQLFVDVFDEVLDLKNPEIEKYLRDLHYEYKGQSMILQFEEARKHFSLNVDPEYLMNRNELIQINNAENMKLFKSVKEVLQKLKKHNKTVTVCSNRQTSSLQKIAKKVGLKNKDIEIISCSDLGYEKPNPYCLNMIVKKYKDPKSSYIFFGDSKTDKDFAEAAGIDYLIVDHYLNNNNFYKIMLEAFISD